MLQLKKMYPTISCILTCKTHILSINSHIISTHVNSYTLSTRVSYQFTYPINSCTLSTHVSYQLMQSISSFILLIHISYQLMYSVNLCTCILPTHTSYQLRYSINSCILQDQISFKTHESYQDICLSKCCFYPY